MNVWGGECLGGERLTIGSSQTRQDETNGLVPALEIESFGILPSRIPPGNANAETSSIVRRQISRGKKLKINWTWSSEKSTCCEAVGCLLVPPSSLWGPRSRAKNKQKGVS